MENLYKTWKEHYPSGVKLNGWDSFKYEQRAGVSKDERIMHAFAMCIYPVSIVSS